MKGLGKLVAYLVLLIGAVVMLMPFAWMVVTSFKLPSEVEEWPPKWGSKNFLTKRPINVVEDFYENVLVLDVNDDPFIRGEVHILFPKGLDYARQVPTDEVLGYFERHADVFDKSLDSFRNSGDFIVYAYKTLKEHMGKTPFREEAIGILEKSQKAMFSIKRYMSRLKGREKEDFEKYFDEVGGRIINALQELKRIYSALGEAYLSREKVKKVHAIFGYLKGVLESKPKASSKMAAGILRLFSKKVEDPIVGVEKIYSAYLDLWKLLDDVQKDRTGPVEVIARFRSAEEKFARLNNEFSKLPELADLWRRLKEEAKKNPDKFLTVFETELQVEKNKAMDRLKKEIKGVLLSGDEDQILRDMKDVLKKMVDVSYGKGIDVGRILQESGSVEEMCDMLRNEALSAASKMEEYKSFYRMEGLKTTLNAIESTAFRIKASLSVDPLELLKELYKLQKEFSALENKGRAAIERAVNEMEIVEKPELVRDVRIYIMKGKDMTLEHLKVFLDIHSFNLLDDEIKMAVFFSPKDLFKNVFQNYVDAWHAAPFARYYLNTVFVASTTTILEVIIASMAAFAFSILSFPGRDFLFGLFLATMMVPGEVLLVPNFITITKLGWIDTYYALIVPWIVSVFAIFLIRQHFMTLPRELYDAAKIDGCSNWRYLWTIAVPLSKPVIITGALLKFVGSWNAFLWVLIVTNDERYRTLPVGLHAFSTDAGTLYNQLMAAATFSVLPVIVLFLFVQRYFIQGIARTGLK